MSDASFSTFHAPLAAALRDARVQAFRPPLVANGFDGGLIVGDDPAHQRLRHSRYWQPVDRHDPRADFRLRLDGAYVYFGPVYDHFGHMMAEMVHRLVPSLELFGERMPLLLVDEAGRTEPRRWPGLPPFLRDVLALLGVGPERVVVTRRDLVVAELHACEQGSDFGGGPKEGYLPWLDAAVMPRLDARFRDSPRYEKVYVSRSRHRAGGAFLGEAYLERLLAAEGFTVFHPQEHDAAFQMHVYRSAEVLVFGEGSAVHGVELLGAEALGDCHLLLRRENHREVFGRVLRPRARALGIFAGAVDLGSAVVDDDAEPIEYLGLSAFRCAALLDHFRGNGIARLRQFDIGAYVTQARADLARYAGAWGASRSPALSATQLAQVWQRLMRALEDEVI